MQMQANIAPIISLNDEGEFPVTTQEIENLEDFMTQANLQDNIVFTVAKGYVGGELIEEYKFMVTRRYLLDGELHLGGANGEVLNMTAFAYQLKALLKKHGEAKNR